MCVGQQEAGNKSQVSMLTLIDPPSIVLFPLPYWCHKYRLIVERLGSFPACDLLPAVGMAEGGRMQKRCVIINVRPMRVKGRQHVTDKNQHQCGGGKTGGCYSIKISLLPLPGNLCLAWQMFVSLQKYTEMSGWIYLEEGWETSQGRTHEISLQSRKKKKYIYLQ